MDLNPSITFGQHLLDTLSQGSGGSKSSRHTSNSKKKKSSGNNDDNHAEKTTKNRNRLPSGRQQHQQTSSQPQHYQQAQQLQQQQYYPSGLPPSSSSGAISGGGGNFATGGLSQQLLQQHQAQEDQRYHHEQQQQQQRYQQQQKQQQQQQQIPQQYHNYNANNHNDDNNNNRNHSKRFLLRENPPHNTMNQQQRQEQYWLNRSNNNNNNNNNNQNRNNSTMSLASGRTGDVSSLSHATEKVDESRVGAGNNNNNNSNTATLSHVDEAYRRLGHRLSLQAHGDMLPNGSEPRVARIEASQFSGFASFGSNNRGGARDADKIRSTTTANGDGNSSVNCSNEDISRMSKVAKVNYADHGEHAVQFGTADKQRHEYSSDRTADVHLETKPQHLQSQDNGDLHAKTNLDAKTGASSPQLVVSKHLLKSLTIHAKEKFRKWHEAEQLLHRNKSAAAAGKGGGKRDMSPQHYTAFSQLDLAGQKKNGGSSNDPGQPSSEWSQQAQQHHAINGPQHHHVMGPPASSKHMHPHPHRRQHQAQKGLLSAVMEGHSESADHSTRTSPSISTKDSCLKDASIAGTSITSENHSKQQQQSSSGRSNGPIHGQQEKQAPLIRGKCLTTPSQGVTNDGWDNAEGNLIVHENDVIIVPRKSLHTVSPSQQNQHQENIGGSAEFRVITLLGQGTFAQVFKCLHVPSGKEVAVKVVKNKPAYTRQAAVEIDVFRAVQETTTPNNNTYPVAGGEDGRASTSTPKSVAAAVSSKDYMVNLVCFFMHRSHLCLVFELLGLNLYEVLKKRQFRGLPLSVVQSIIHQAMVGIKDLSQKSIVHCDLKPENVLLVSDEVEEAVVRAGETNWAKKESSGETKSSKDSKTGMYADPTHSDSSGGTIQTANTSDTKGFTSTNKRERIKIIDFGSACFEGYTAHTYIQSRFYRSPEVLIGLPYDSAIDMWSLGCVAAELFLGLPILPGVHEHDQLGRITEMVGKVPDWMLEQGSKSTKYYLKCVVRQAATPSSADMIRTPSPGNGYPSPSPSPSAVVQWRLKTQQEYIASLSQNEIRKKGGLAKLEKQPGNRYFKRKRLADILALHAQSTTAEDRELLPAFVHFLYGLLDLDPWKRWTALQAIQHPFLTGDLSQLRAKTHETKIDPKEENQANLDLGLYWQSPWDPAVCRRKLLNVQRMREKQQAMRRNSSNRPSSRGSIGEGAVDRWQARVGIQSGTPMDESPGPNKYQQRNSSPPKQVTSSPSTAVSNQSMTPLPILGRATSDYQSGPSPVVPQGGGQQHSRVSLSGGRNSEGNPSMQLHRQYRNGAPSSFGIDGNATGAALHNEGGFVNRSFIQQHGAFPSGRNVDNPPHSPAVPWSIQPQHSGQQHQNEQGFAIKQNPIMAVALPHSDGTLTTQPITQNSVLYSEVGPSVAQVAAGNYPNSANVGNRYSENFQSTLPTNIPLHGSTAVGPSLSASSSITIPDAPVMINPHTGYPYSEHQQVPLRSQAEVQQQHQQFNIVQQPINPQQSGHLQYAQGSQSYGVQSQPQHLQVQQPLYLAGTPGGGYYYVTTSAMGQPIVLQPVGLLNQQPNQLGYSTMNPEPQIHGHQGHAHFLSSNATAQQGQHVQSIQHNPQNHYQSSNGPSGHSQQRTNANIQQNSIRRNFYGGGTSM